jgi:hypothetical protein
VLLNEPVQGWVPDVHDIFTLEEIFGSVNVTFEGTIANVNGITNGLLSEGQEHTDFTANSYDVYGVKEVSIHD